MARKSKKFSLNRKTGLISGAAVLVIVIAALAFWHYHNHQSQEVIPSTISQSKPSQQSSTENNSSNSPSSNNSGTTSSSGTSSKNTQNPTDNSGQGPVAPTGNFVSNHHPGGNYPTVEQSVCNTTSGASCYIKFTNGNDTKTLDAQITDSSGVAIWNWDAASFPSGDWQITAVATLNGQTKTATDATALTIQ